MTRLAGVPASLLLICCLFLCAQPALAQAARTGRLLVTVVDQTGAVIPAATVTVLGLEEATKRTPIEPVKSSDKGIATIERLVPGRYSVQAEFPGFDIGWIKEVRVRAGDNRHVLVLPLLKLTEEVTVGRDAQTAASDRASAFGTALTREQVEALSEDPDEMQRQLQEIAGPGAAIRVDSFEGQQLPPKAQIKSIHITRDMFAAENHYAGGLFIDIITQPGVGPITGRGNFRFYDSATDGQNPFVPRKGPAQNRSGNLNLSGALIKNKSSFSLSVSGTNSYTTPNLYAATLSGTRAENLNLRQPSNSVSVYGQVDYAITKDQTLRTNFSRYWRTWGNQGVGAYDLIERAYTTDMSSYNVRIQEAGPIGRRFFINTRFSLNWSDNTNHSAVEAPTIVVNDAFTSGGAQVAGGSYTRTFLLASDLDYVRGIQSWRAGIQINGGRYRTDDVSNYLGTYTFTSLAAYQAGLPTTYTRRIGDPNIAYWNVQGAFYVQDDIRISKTFTLSPGVRVEAQTHLKDYNNIGPRFGITWSPFKGGKTTLRGSAGIFYDWLSSGTYEQTLRVDGLHQQELAILDPAYPDPGTGVAPATTRYLLGSDIQMARNTRFSAGFSQQITKQISVGATYAHVRGDDVLVGTNLNAPVDGVRPDPAFANIIRSESAGSSRSQSISSYANVSLSRSASPNVFSLSGAGPMAKGSRFDWRRGLSLGVNYYLGKSENNTAGAFSVPASGNLATEWGPSSSDTRHQIYLNFSTGALKNLSANVYVYASSGSPYTIRTGYDDNGDLIFNDRPAGVGRNTMRMPWSWDSSAYFSYTVGIGKHTVPGGPGITISSQGGALSVGTATVEGAPRYRLIFNLSVSNLTNHANYTGYSGVMTSPFFLKPTGVDGVRTMNFSIGFSF